MSLVTIAVTGTYQNVYGNALSGSVSFAPSEVVKDTTDKIVMFTSPVVVELDVNGQFEISLPCTDNTGLTPINFVYNVAENISGVQRNYQISLPQTLGTTVDITALQ